MNNRRETFMNLLNDIFLHIASLDEKSGHILARFAAAAIMEIQTRFF